MGAVVVETWVAAEAEEEGGMKGRQIQMKVEAEELL